MGVSMGIAEAKSLLGKVSEIAEIKAKIGYVNKVKNIVSPEKAAKKYDFWAQKIQLVDGDEKIYIDLSFKTKEDCLSANQKGQEIVITKTKLESYTNKEGVEVPQLRGGYIKDNIIQERVTEKPTQQQPKQQEKEEITTDWNAKERRDKRAMCISYAKDLAVACQIKQKYMYKVAQRMYDWIYENFNMEEYENKLQESEETNEEIPF